VFISDSDKAIVYEYAHDGTQLGTLSVPGDYLPINCAVDPTTGNLAVVILRSPDFAVAVYTGGQGEPTITFDPSAKYLGWVGYDASGNLFADGSYGLNSFLLTELPKGGSQFSDIATSISECGCGSVQWDGTYITVAHFSPLVIYRLAISGSTSTIEGTTTLLNSGGGKQHKGRAVVTIYGGSVIAPLAGKTKELAFWNYPTGGRPTQILHGLITRTIESSSAVSIDHSR